eukprot:TRINITY_DN406_c0_g2_i1.p1 TRINITY_DN406_c0_g2~~TRINITY_DN406_c0_g2_i1.p1  ORF type:complete len:186 (-),score=70.66 TRINITY_DN406_c0_g2_i1:109-666(-)
MSGRAYQPGGKIYEKRKAEQKRRGPARPRQVEESDSSSEDSDDEPQVSKLSISKKKDDDDDDSDDDDSGSDDDDDDDEDGEKRKGVAGLIEVANPNAPKKGSIKASSMDGSKVPKPELSRREKEEIEKEKAKQAYWELHKAGKTDEAKADLARLAVIRQRREEAAKQKAEEEAAKAAKAAAAKKK